ncbi:MAG: type II toxin-antitoxin system RelE/ParE family toxin [Pyrinomonadaceae bacterium]
MIGYTVVILSAAERQIKKLPAVARRKVIDLAESLSKDPRPKGSKALRGSLNGFFRVRTGNYRIVYAIDDRNVIITVVTVGNRRDIYR